MLAAPITLLLRTVTVETRRRLSRALARRPITILTEPVAAATLRVGGLWALYTTDLYPTMQHRPIVHLLVHLHLLISGYLFTTAMISVDPLPHRRGYRHRSVVVILAPVGHDIVAKYLFAHPPPGGADPAAEAGAMLMYYGGNAVEVTIMIILGWRWYQSGRPRGARRAVTSSPSSRVPGASHELCGEGATEPHQPATQQVREEASPDSLRQRPFSLHHGSAVLSPGGHHGSE